MLFSQSQSVKALVRAAALSLGVQVFCDVSVLPATAAVIGNKDGDAYKLTILENGKRTTLDIAAGGQLIDVCERGCTVILVGVKDGSYTLPEGNEIVTIEEGVLFYDGAVPAKPAEQ